MTKRKQPDFMKELHLIRAKLNKEWQKMSDKEFLRHMHKVGREFRQSLHLRKAASAAP